MKQTKLFLVALMCMLMQTVVCNAFGDMLIPASQLPAAARTFVQKKFPGNKIMYVQRDGLIFYTYDVRLDNGVEIDFDRSGNWDKVDCQYTAVPASIVPAPIASYVKVNFPQMPITKIDKKIYGYSVELSDEFELKFTSNGMLLFMDD